MNQNQVQWEDHEAEIQRKSQLNPGMSKKIFIPPISKNELACYVIIQVPNIAANLAFHSQQQLKDSFQIAFKCFQNS